MIFIIFIINIQYNIYFFYNLFFNKPFFFSNLFYKLNKNQKKYPHQIKFYKSNISIKKISLIPKNIFKIKFNIKLYFLIIPKS